MFKLIAFIFVIYALLITNFYTFKSKYNSDTRRVIGIIDKYEIDGNKLTIYLKGKEMLIVTYYINTELEKEYYQNNIELGDKIEVDGEFKVASNNTLPNIFNYKKYLYYNRIYYLIDADNIRKLSNNKSIFYYVKNKVIDRINKIDKTGYLKIFILGDKSDIDNQVMTNYQVNGVSHLFSISGMHISLLASIILFFLKKISYNNKINYLIVILFLIFYLFLTRVSPSILRATIMFIIFGINKCYNLKIRSIDIMLLVIIIVIVINPFYIYNVGFQFSYLISFTLVLLADKSKNIRGKIKQSLYVSWVCFLISFPIAIYNFYQVNILSIFLNIILIPMVSVIIYPLSLLVFVFPFLSVIFNLMIVLLEYINDLVFKISFLQIIFAKPTILIVFMYYFIIYISLFNKKYLWLFICLLIIHKSYIYLDNNFRFLVMDVGQGDAIFLKMPNNMGNILIDTGGTVSYQKEDWMKRKGTYSIATSKIIPYLKSIGITNLDYLILTHGDYDHMGESIDLVNNFKVEKVIFNNDNYNDLESELIEVLKDKNIKYYKGLKELSVNKYKLQFLNTRSYDNENDNSNVIYFNFNNYKFLFMGDAGVDREKDILDKYNLGDIDFLKVGHHGSNTSSGKEFINSINPKYSLISVGENNRYGHPKDSVLDILANSKVYRTDIDGSIEVKLNKNRYRIRTYKQ